MRCVEGLVEGEEEEEGESSEVAARGVEVEAPSSPPPSRSEPGRAEMKARAVIWSR